MTKTEFLSKVDCLFDGIEFESICDLKIPVGKSHVNINNTSDLWLNMTQFDVIISLVSSQKALYVAQADSDDVYRLTLPTTYEEYYNLNLFSLSFIASECFDWVIAIDEGLEYGKGELIGSKEFVKAFSSLYNASIKIDGLITQEEDRELYELQCDIITSETLSNEEKLI